MVYLYFLATCIIWLDLSVALDNGLALTPPMGWLSWERYRCNIDCKNDPDNCISEDLYIRMADALVFEGYKQWGFQYVNIDDCWSELFRDSNGTLLADRKRFPHGIKWLADYVHFRGLKLGIYGDVGTMTCGGYPGSKGYLQKDAETFASWGVDMLKLDGCNIDIADMEYGYPEMARHLNETGRPILFSCSWPAYQVQAGKVPDYKKIAKYCNIWRNYKDIQDSWDSVLDIKEFYANDTGGFSMVAGPGQYNDPDMLLIGDYGLSYDQQTVQMALWSILAAPLFISADLTHIKPESKALLQNFWFSRINQDPYGIQGSRIIKNGDLEVWTKPMGLDAKGMAFAFINLSEGGGPLEVNIPLYRLGLNEAEGYNVTNIIEMKYISVMKPHDIISASVNPSGVWMGYADYDC